MALTRAQLETVLICRVGAWLVYVSLDGTSHAGANADLNDPIAVALQQTGYSVADVTAVADADLASVSASAIPRILDLAELRALETVLQSATQVDVAGLDYSAKRGQFADRVLATIAALREKIAAVYGPIVSAGPYVGGISVSDKQAADQDTDRVPPAFAKNLQRDPRQQPTPSDDWWRY